MSKTSNVKLKQMKSRDHPRKTFFGGKFGGKVVRFGPFLSYSDYLYTGCSQPYEKDSSQSGFIMGSLFDHGK